MFALMVALVGESIFNNIPGFNGPPEFYFKMKNNPALSGLILFLVLPSYVQSFANTGAFEIYVDEKLVRNYLISIYSSTNVVFFLTLVQLYIYMCTKIYSKLATGRMPNILEVFKALENAGLKRANLY